ncbi:type II toxin-antitoxin system Phd/YefM family antitoxin [Amaricoccus solimangrovi]|uniref:Antitoxin n=1 Tax=Amaricoccus solimangrovi TaxID=2589815 RepID=A0A501WD60_9RHOB|nr:type II toxin-antitoxin system Phd/YefM family antitoxin [Amaricoccus solimangrovi]TPE47883.1 type II toxin-antitoxin system Phd/YefM family antitoxin [Amaricoccus solimangrovi]
MDWPLQDAKNQFSKVVRRAREEGPQVVTLRGVPAVVVLSAEEYTALRAGTPNMIDALLSGPTWDDDLVDDVQRRDKSPSRAPAL